MIEKTFDIKDAEYHLKRADEFEKRGEFIKQRLELELYFRDGGRDKEPLLKLAELYSEEGKRKKYKKQLKRVIELFPDDPIVRQKIEEFLEDEKDYEYFEDYIPKEIESSYEIITPPDNVVLRFIELFSGREGVYAKMWKNYDNSISYSPIAEPFNFNIAKNHLLGNYTIGIYPVRIDNTVGFSVFDIDIKKRYLKEVLEHSEDFEKLKQKAFQTAESIKEVLNVYGLTSYIEDSGFKGYHVWLFYDEPLSAHYIKKFMENVLQGNDKKFDEISIEIFPKQSKVKENRYGSLIKLPGSFHLKTGIRSAFISAEKDEKGFYDFIMKIERNPKNKILEIVKNIKEDKEESSQIDLRVFSYLRSRCPVLDYLTEKAEREEPLTREERNAIIYTIGHLDDGPEIVNYLLKRYIERGDVEPMKKKHKGYPMSCAKLRRNLKHITSEVACNCVFEEIGSYPHPLLHLKDIDEKVLSSTKVKPFISDFQKNIDRYFDLKKRLKEIEREIKNIEEYFNERFRESQVNILETDIGRFIRVVNPNGKITFHYELK